MSKKIEVRALFWKGPAREWTDENGITTYDPGKHVWKRIAVVSTPDEGYDFIREYMKKHGGLNEDYRLKLIK